ncbi:MAG TPA: DUF2515 family protein [Byssovorax sp.]
MIDAGDAAIARMLGELDARNADNTTRTASYLELYAVTRARQPELPWLLMAHLVSRNAGYLMSDLARTIDRGDAVFSRASLEELFVFLERANWLIFWDAWHHVAMHLLGRSRELGDRVAPLVRTIWPRYEGYAVHGVDAPLERALVLDLVQNEQEIIERYVVHAPAFPRARAMVTFFEAAKAERPIALPLSDARIVVGGFLDLATRVDAGRRIFDEVLADRARRDAIFDWALARPHTGSRAVAGGRATPTIAEAWPIERVRALAPNVHAPPPLPP